MSDRGQAAETYRTPDGEEHLVLDHDCEDGWRGEDLQGRPVPCPMCRPHLHRHRGLDAAVMSGWTTTNSAHRHTRPATT